MSDLTDRLREYKKAGVGETNAYGFTELIGEAADRIDELEADKEIAIRLLNGWETKVSIKDRTIKELEDGLEKGKDYCVSLSKTVTELTIENESRYKRIKELEAVVEQRNAESQIASEEINRMLSDFLESVRATLNASRNWKRN